MSGDRFPYGGSFLGEGLRKVSLPVTGMSCAACARRVEKALSGAEGVSVASVNLAAEKAVTPIGPGHCLKMKGSGRIEAW